MQKAVLFLSMALIVAPDIALAQQQLDRMAPGASRPDTRPTPPSRPTPNRPAPNLTTQSRPTQSRPTPARRFSHPVQVAPRFNRPAPASAARKSNRPAPAGRNRRAR